MESKARSWVCWASGTLPLAREGSEGVEPRWRGHAQAGRGPVGHQANQTLVM